MQKPFGLAGAERARKCLALIEQIAARGASSPDPAHIGYALQELTQVMIERIGYQRRRLEPVPADQIAGLPALLEELEFVDSLSESMHASRLV